MEEVGEDQSNMNQIGSVLSTSVSNGLMLERQVITMETNKKGGNQKNIHISGNI